MLVSFPKAHRVVGGTWFCGGRGRSEKKMSVLIGRRIEPGRASARQVAQREVYGKLHERRCTR